jgi:hypothetical protein
MNKKISSILSFSAGVVAGGIAGYFGTKKYLSTVFEEDLNEQIEDVKRYYSLLRKEGTFSSPEAAKETLSQVVRQYQFDQPEDPANDEIEETQEEKIDTENPYIVSVEEYMQERQDLDKVTLTYYEGDDVLCDDRDVAILDYETFIGNDALSRFGHLSKDPNVVYVRNEKIEIDYEILKDHRSFSEAVLGIREEKEVRRMREDD